VPQPVVGRTPSELRAYIEGSDQVSGRPFMQEVIDGLTRPLDDADLTGATFERSTPRLVARTPKRIFASCFSTIAGPISCPSCCRPRDASRNAQGDEQPPDKVVGRMRAGNFRETWSTRSKKSRSMR